MSNEKIVNIYIEEGILLRLISSKENADYVIEFGKKEIIKCIYEDELIKKYLKNSGISLNAGGFNYLLMAINIVSEKLENNIRYSLTNDVYPLIAEKFCVTEISVEKAIWNVINRSNKKGTGAKRFIEKYKLGM